MNINVFLIRNCLILIWLFCNFILPLPVMAQPVTPSSGRDMEIRAAVTAFIQQKTSGLGCETRIKRLTIVGNQILPPGELDFEVVAPQQWEGWGSAGVAVIVRQGDRVLRNISVRVEVEALAEMVVTKRQIDHGSIININDLMLRKQDISLAQGHYLGRIEDVAGKKARSIIKANASVRPEQLEKVPLIKSGQVVTIVIENERMRITVTGKARSSGAEGDTITVQNLNSLKEIPAKVIDTNTVSAVF